MAEKQTTTISRRAFMRSASAVTVGAAAAVAAPSPALPSFVRADAMLLELGRQWEAAKQRLDALEAQFSSIPDDQLYVGGPADELWKSEFEPACDHKNELTEGIFSIHPVSLAGARVQARVLVEGKAFDLFDAADGWAVSLIADLLAIVEGRA